MADSRVRHEWNMVSAFRADLANLFRSKDSTPITPKELHPMYAKEESKPTTKRVGLNVLMMALKGRATEVEMPETRPING